MARIRTFLAVELAPGVRKTLAGWQAQLAAAASAAAWVSPDHLHLTLAFLGDVNDRDVFAVCRAAQTAVKSLPRFEIAVAGVGGFPNDRRPKTLWAGVRDGAESVIALQAALADRLEADGFYRREHRPFAPHITLGRLKADGDAPFAWPPAGRGWAAGVTAVREVVVFSSTLRAEGPEYAVLGRAGLA